MVSIRCVCVREIFRLKCLNTFWLWIAQSEWEKKVILRFYSHFNSIIISIRLYDVIIFEYSLNLNEIRISSLNFALRKLFVFSWAVKLICVFFFLVMTFTFLCIFFFQLDLVFQLTKTVHWQNWSEFFPLLCLPVILYVVYITFNNNTNYFFCKSNKKRNFSTIHRKIIEWIHKINLNSMLVKFESQLVTKKNQLKSLVFTLKTQLILRSFIKWLNSYCMCIVQAFTSIKPLLSIWEFK